jgi:hypothetical protein
VSWHWSAAVGFALASCGGAGKAVPTEVEIDWPDAAVAGPAPATPSVDAGMVDGMPSQDADTAPTPSE